MISMNTKNTTDKDISFLLEKSKSHLRFNIRVLRESQRERTPLLEKIRFLSIVHNNLDEFFEVRVSALEQKLSSYSNQSSEYKQTKILLERIERITSNMIKKLYKTWQEIIPQLNKQGYKIHTYQTLNNSQKEFADLHFTNYISPLITAIKINLTHPFPWLINKALYIAVQLSSGKEDELGIITIPRSINRIIELPSQTPHKQAHKSQEFILLSDLIQAHISSIFEGYKRYASAAFRIIRNSNLYLNEEEVSDLLQAIEIELHNRKKGDIVRLDIHKVASPELIRTLQNMCNLENRQISLNNGPVNFSRLNKLHNLIERDELKFSKFSSKIPTWYNQIINEPESFFSLLKKKDILLHHPFDSYKPILRLLQQASSDPNTRAIKMTLYRTSNESPIIQYLIEAAQNGKEVSVLVELKARFDEESNVQWAKNLLEHGVHVIYGIKGLKIHCKFFFIVREENKKLQTYVHIGTGNYNEVTAKTYTDLSLFTSNPFITKEVSSVFHMLTTQYMTPSFKYLLISPYQLKEDLLKLIDNEIAYAQNNNDAQIIFKVNGLEEIDIINKLYEASQAGVRIIGLVRGICCLIPNQQGLSENIEIRSIIGQFLEHSRIFYFKNAPKSKVYIGSADLKKRNLLNRVELLTPILSKEIEHYIINTILNTYLKDSENTRINRYNIYSSLKIFKKKHDHIFDAHAYFFEV